MSRAAQLTRYDRVEHDLFDKYKLKNYSISEIVTHFILGFGAGIQTEIFFFIKQLRVLPSTQVAYILIKIVTMILMLLINVLSERCQVIFFLRI